MTDLRSTVLSRLAAQRLPGLGLAEPETLQIPQYDGYSLVNLSASLCHWLGVPQFGAAPLAAEILNLWQGPFQHVVFLLVDALGLDLFASLLDDSAERIDHAGVWARLFMGDSISQASLAPLTSIAPSTTSAALTSLWTGQPPARHGIMGYEVWLKEYSLIANMIFHAPTSFASDIGGLRRAGFQPESFLPLPTLGTHLGKLGVRSYAFQHSAIARSGLSTMLLPGVETAPYRSAADLWVSVSQLMETHPDEKNLIYVYWGDVDELSHRFGPRDQRVALEFASFSRQVEYFLSRLSARGKGDTLFLLAADHGQIPTPRRAEYDLRNYPRLLSCLTMAPSGEGRLPYLYVRSGREQELKALVQEFWRDQFILLPAEQVVAAGLFGSGGLYARVPERVGDIIVFPRGGAYWWWADKENPLLGRHGGLTPAEMLVPLFGFVV